MPQIEKKIQYNLVSSGFTLVELLVVIGIIGILSGVVVGSTNYLRDEAKATAMQTEMNELRKALESYHEKHGQYVDQALTPAGGGEYTDYEGD